MSTSTLGRSAAVMILAGALCVPAAIAQTPQVSTITLTEPTDVGGTILQPGNYQIRVLPGFTSRNRVQITDVNQETVYTTLLTVPHQAGPNAEIPNTRLVFYPAAQGQPRALRTWFPPDPVDNEGHDIVYEEERARQIARAAATPVVTYRGPVVVTEPETPELRVVTPEARIEPYVAPRITRRTEPAPVQTRTETVRTETRTRTELPRTASNVPLFTLLGLISLAGAFVLRGFNR